MENNMSSSLHIIYTFYFSQWFLINILLCKQDIFVKSAEETGKKFSNMNKI